MPKIHPLAYVDPAAELAADVEVGPFAFVEAGAVLGAGCRVDSHATVKGNTILGERNYVGQGTVLGGDPQSVRWKGEPTYLRVGDDNTFREYVTIHRATHEGGATVVGNGVYIMAYSHLGHDCVVEDKVTIANSVGVSGHVTIETLATVGGMVGVHQFARIGRVAMVGGMSRITRDVPPYMIVEGENGEVHDINAVGLRKIGITQEARTALHKACKLLFKSQLGLRNALEVVRREVPLTEEVKYLLAYEERRYKGRNGRGDQS